MYPPILSPPPTPLPTPPRQAFPEHQLWVPGFMHWTGTGHLFLHTAMYMFRCDSPKSSYIVLLPLSLKVCSSCWCFLCCAACRIIGNWYISVSTCEKGKVRNPRASNILSKWCQSCPHLFNSYPIGGNWSCGHTLLQRRVGNVGSSKAASWRREEWIWGKGAASVCTWSENKEFPLEAKAMLRHKEWV